MGDVVPFRAPDSRSKGRMKTGKAQPRGLCQHGYHKWVIDQNRPFDSKKGRLVTSYHCERCGKRKVKAE